MTFADLRVDMKVKDLRCPSCDIAIIKRLADGQALIQYPNGIRTWADPHQLELI